MKQSIAVIGVGSPFGDDQLAAHVIQLLKEKLPQDQQKITLEYYDRPGLYLLELIKPYKEVHLIDAIISGKPAGTIHRYDNLEKFQKNTKLSSSHMFGVAEVLSLGDVLACLPDKVIIHAVEIRNNNSTITASSEIHQSYQLIAGQIIEEIMTDQSQEID